MISTLKKMRLKKETSPRTQSPRAYAFAKGNVKLSPSCLFVLYQIYFGFAIQNFENVPVKK